MKWFFAIFLTFSFVFLMIFGVNCLYGTVYPIKYQDEISYACAQCDLEKAAVYSLINIESGFKKDAVSPKGAVGLMQILPSTAKEISNDEPDLFSPQTNILIGCKYLKTQIENFKDVKLALCAYNAGPANVRKWLCDEKYSKDGKTLEEIPFKETREYIEKFEKNYKYYSKKHLK